MNEKLGQDVSLKILRRAKNALLRMTIWEANLR